MKRLSGILRDGSLLPPAAPIGRPERVSRASQRIRNLWPDTVIDDPETDPETLAREMDRRRRTNDWRGFSWADATATAHAFFGSGLRSRWRFRRLRKFLIDQVGPGCTPAYMRTAFHKYLETYERKSDMTRRLAAALAGNRRDAGIAELALAGDRLRIFDVDAAPQATADYMDAEDAPFEALRRAGIAAPHGAGLMQEAHRRFLHKIAPAIEAGRSGAVVKLLRWIAPESGGRHIEGEGAGAAIDALLRPWIRQDPPKSIKDTIKTGLIDTYGDPRLTDAGVWAACASEARDVMLRWIVGATIEIFFEIIKIADPTPMCMDRMELWTDLYKENRIDEAWAALSRAGAREARALALRANDRSIVNFGRNMSSNICLLIMKINGRWVVEGSSSYKTRIFRRGDRSSVVPYRNTYNSHEFIRHREVDEEIIHRTIDRWRNNVMAALQR